MLRQAQHGVETKRTPYSDAPWVSIRPVAYPSTSSGHRSTGSRLADYEMALPGPGGGEWKMTRLTERSAEPFNCAQDRRSRRSLVGKRPRLWVATGVFGLCLVVYVLTLAPGVLGGDSGELQYIPYILGVAHPTGYPLYTLLGWLWAHGVVVGDVAYRMNLLSAVLGASTATVLYLIAHHLTSRHAPALLAAVLFAFSPTFWMQAIVAEVYTLHTALVVLVIYLLLRWEAARPSVRDLLLAALAYGLSLTHHRVIIIFLPALALFVWLTDRSVFTNAKLLLKIAVLGFSPLLLYLYAPLRIRQLYPSIFHDQILDNLWGTSFGVEFEWPTVAVVGKFFVLLIRQYGWAVVLAIWGLVASLVMLSRNRSEFQNLPDFGILKRCRPWAVMLLVAGLCNAFFGLFYQAFDVEVFLLPFYLLFALWVGLGWQTLHKAISARIGSAVATVLLLPALAWSLWNGYNQLAVDRIDVRVRDIPPLSRSIAQTADEMFSYPYERDSTILVDWGMAYALQYRQAVEGVRTDLEVMPINLARRFDYVLLEEILAGRRPRRIYHLSAIVRYPVTASRPLYVIRQPLSMSTRTEANISLAKEAEGVVRVVPDDPIPSHRLDWSIGSGVVLVGYEMREEELHLYWQASQPLDEDYGTFVRFFDGNGELIGQQDKPADDLEVLHMTTSEWEVGQTVRDVFALPESTAWIEIGMHRSEGEGIVPHGETTSVELDF